jgi:CspA family cold shock protein
MAIGVVKSFDREAGHGFLAVEGGKDVFFRASDVEGAAGKSLGEGTRVQFEVRDGANGPEATNVKLVSRTEP